MMKNKILLILIPFFLFFTSLKSQITSGKILYRVDMESQYAKMKSTGTSPDMLAMTKVASKAAETIVLELVFTEELAVFKKQKSLSLIEIPELKNFIDVLFAKGNYYTNLEKDYQILETEQQDRSYYVKSAISKKDWILTKETKKIGQFQCYKAIYHKQIAGKPKDIIAWYTPEIPLSLGPKEYVGNLPGLILELIEPIGTIVCENITLNPKNNIVIDWPKNMNTITQEEYKNEGDKLYQKVKAGRN